MRSIYLVVDSNMHPVFKGVIGPFIDEPSALRSQTELDMPSRVVHALSPSDARSVARRMDLVDLSIKLGIPYA